MVWILLLLLAVAIGFGIWGLLRYRYVQSLRSRGWVFDSSPPKSVAWGYNVPPFGIGLERRVDDHISGHASDGTPFAAFKYFSDTFRDPGYLVCMPLPAPLPPAEVAGPQAKQLPLGPQVFGGQVSASAPDPQHAQYLLQAVGGHLPPTARISIDHHRVVLVGAPKNADGLGHIVEILARARAAILVSPLAQLTGPPAPEKFGFYGKPGWHYIPRDDDYLRWVEHSRSGFDHEAHEIIVSNVGPIDFVRVKHTWKTRRTKTDSDGRTTTVTEHHTEHLCQFTPNFPFRDISLNWGLLGFGAQKFEWEEFNRRYKVRAADPKFASDVFHQRQMEFLMSFTAPDFIYHNGQIRMNVGGQWRPENIDAALAFLYAFFARVPDFVWQDLGAWPRPIPEISA